MTKNINDMEGQSKYLALYNGRAIPFDDIRDFAVSELGFDVIPKDDGGWRIVINGKTITMTYSDEWTRDEVIDDFLESMLIPNVERYVYGLYFYEAMVLTK
jgi:hypothetical protein